ncbi:hypothetical protein GX865_00475 [Candidatus Saccharibacteria bacterium]|jgi:hypothetical protein|nr:hypothetical protein [Candidatus Saccharibacteria bacterium]
MSRVRFKARSPLHASAAVRGDIIKGRSFTVYNRNFEPTMCGKFLVDAEDLPEDGTVPVALLSDGKIARLKLSDLGMAMDSRNRWNENLFTIVGPVQKKEGVI